MSAENQNSPKNSLENIPIPDEKLFSMYSYLNTAAPTHDTVKKEDWDWLVQLYQMSIQDRDAELARRATRERIIQLYEQCKRKSTATYDLISPLSETTATNVFGGYTHLNKEGIKDLVGAGVSDVFLYQNHVGNSKPLPFLVVEGRKYILKNVDDAYFNEYSKIQASEHRPEARPLVLGRQHYGLFEFKGEQVMDFTDRNQLKQLCDIGIASAKRLTEFDPNPGNLLVDSGQVYYIDQALSYTNQKTIGESIVGNIGACITNIPKVAETTCFLDAVLFVIQAFKDAFAPVPLSEKENYKGERHQETPDELIQGEIAWFFVHGKNEGTGVRVITRHFPRFTPEVEKRIKDAIRELFVV